MRTQVECVHSVCVQQQLQLDSDDNAMQCDVYVCMCVRIGIHLYAREWAYPMQYIISMRLCCCD